MTIEEASVYLESVPSLQDNGVSWSRPLYFDYLKGRVMKVDLSKDEIETAMYDRDNGQGAAEIVINELRERLEK